MAKRKPPSSDSRRTDPIWDNAASSFITGLIAFGQTGIGKSSSESPPDFGADDITRALDKDAPGKELPS
jgi:hypothetical protein